MRFLRREVEGDRASDRLAHRISAIPENFCGERGSICTTYDKKFGTGIHARGPVEVEIARSSSMDERAFGVYMDSCEQRSQNCTETSLAPPKTGASMQTGNS